MVIGRAAFFLSRQVSRINAPGKGFLRLDLSVPEMSMMSTMRKDEWLFCSLIRVQREVAFTGVCIRRVCHRSPSTKEVGKKVNSRSVVLSFFVFSGRIEFSGTIYHGLR